MRRLTTCLLHLRTVVLERFLEAYARESFKEESRALRDHIQRLQYANGLLRAENDGLRYAVRRGVTINIEK